MGIKKDSALNDLQLLICYKIKPNQKPVQVWSTLFDLQ